MSLRVTAWHDTPNPNALKAELSAPIPTQVRSFRSADAARAEPLAARLFEVPGVTGLLFGDGWLTVNKDPGTPWRSVKAAVEKTLKQA